MVCLLLPAILPNNKIPLSGVFILLFLYVDMSFRVYAGASTPSFENQLPPRQLSTQNNKGFVENRGQMVDMKGNPTPHVLFKTEAPELNFWITEQGITIQTFIIRKEPTGENLETQASNSPLPTPDFSLPTQNPKPKTRKTLHWERIDVELKGATIKKENIVKENPLQGHYNYFYAHCPEGIYEVHEYEKVTIKHVYSGIDWVFYRKADGSLKYDFVVHPGADYKQIELLYKSKTPVSINKLGEIELSTSYGNVKENTPVSFYEGKKIITRFKQNSQGPITISGDQGYKTSIQFELPNPELRTPNSPLIIDPQLTWATFYGGNHADGPMSIDTDGNGNVFTTGYMGSTDFPVENNGTFFQGNKQGGAMYDIFIHKFNNNGVLQWATYYGGTETEFGASITVDLNGNIFVTGYTKGGGFPLHNSGTFFQPVYGGGNFDAFILKFDNSGNRLWATYYGGSNGEESRSVTTDSQNNVYITGFTYSTDFPLQSPIQATKLGTSASSDAFIVKFDNAGNRIWATYYGGSNNEQTYSIAVDANNNLFIFGLTQSPDLPLLNAGTFFQPAYGGGGSDAFILKLNNTGTPVWCTYYGGTGDDLSYNNQNGSIVVDLNNNVFITGRTTSLDFPLHNSGSFFQPIHAGGENDVFIVKFDNSGNRLWATYYGGEGEENNNTSDNLAIDACGNVYVSFNSSSPTNILLQNSCDGGYFDNSHNGNSDIFLCLFDNTGNLLWSTYFGGKGLDFREAIAVDQNNNVFITGEWLGKQNNSYPRKNPGGGAFYDGTSNANDDGYIAKFVQMPIVAGVDVVQQPDCENLFGGIAEVTGPCNYKYLWSNGQTDVMATGLSAGSYSVIITNHFCKDTLIHFNVTLSVTGVSTSTITFVNCDSYTHNNQTYSTSGIYTQTYTGISGCDSVLTLDLTIHPSFSANYTITACPNESVMIHEEGQKIPGIYSKTYTAYNGCDSVSLITLEHYPAPEALFTIEPNPVAADNPANFTSRSTGATSWFWQLGDESQSTSTQQHTVHIYNQPGIYMVHHIVHNQYGCNDTSIQLLTVEPDAFVLYTPNTFTPDNDGKNDVFLPITIEIANIQEYNLYIFDRWGNLIFMTQNPAEGWDGRANNGKHIAQIDTYVWKINLTDTQGQKHQYIGHINLLR